MIKAGMEVAICTHNGAERLPQVFAALGAQTLPASSWSVLLVDNASTDGTAFRAPDAWARKDVPLRIVKEPTPGVKEARMRAIRESSREYICFCDDDNLLAPDYLENSLRIMGGLPLAGALGGRGVAAGEGPLPPWFEVAAPGYAVGPQADAEGEVPQARGFVYTAGMVLRRRAWDQVAFSGFRPRLMGRTGAKLGSGEDNEMCLLLGLLGWRIHYSPALEFRHLIGRRKLDERYCRGLFRGFGEAKTILNAYRDFLLKRACPGSWRRCATLRLAESLYARASARARAPDRSPLNEASLRREVAAGFAEGCRSHHAGGRLFNLYAEISDWLRLAGGRTV